MSAGRRVRTLTFTLAAAGALLAPAAFGQVRGGTTGTTGGAGTTGGTTGTTGSVPGRTTTPTTPGTTAGQPSTPIFLSGRVVLEEGGQLPGQAVIEMACGSSRRAEGYTDARGNFSIQLGGQNSGVFQDASESSSGPGMPGGGYGGGMNGGMSDGMGMAGMNPVGRYRNCELRARLSGYRSQSVPLSMLDPTSSANIGTILLHRESPAEGNTISVTSAAAPKDARKAFEKGDEAEKKKKPEDAAKDYQKAVDTYPQYALAWYRLGRLEAAQGQDEAARKAFESALGADSKYVEPYVGLTLIELQAQHWQGLAEISDRALRLDPFDYPQLFLFNALANYNLNKAPQAEKSAREAERLDTRHRFPQTNHLLGVIMAQRQDYTDAAEELRNYLKYAPNASDAAAVQSQLDQVEKLLASAAPEPPKP